MEGRRVHWDRQGCAELREHVSTVEVTGDEAESMP